MCCTAVSKRPCRKRLDKPDMTACPCGSGSRNMIKHSPGSTTRVVRMHRPAAVGLPGRLIYPPLADSLPLGGRNTDWSALPAQFYFSDAACNCSATHLRCSERVRLSLHASSALACASQSSLLRASLQLRGLGGVKFAVGAE